MKPACLLAAAISRWSARLGAFVTAGVVAILLGGSLVPPSQETTSSSAELFLSGGSSAASILIIPLVDRVKEDSAVLQDLAQSLAAELRVHGFVVSVTSTQPADTFFRTFDFRRAGALQKFLKLMRQPEEQPEPKGFVLLSRSADGNEVSAIAVDVSLKKKRSARFQDRRRIEILGRGPDIRDLKGAGTSGYSYSYRFTESQDEFVQRRARTLFNQLFVIPKARPR